MEEYNLKKLDPMDFEKLCKDIMNIYLKLQNDKFYRGKSGKDGGIDLLNKNEGIIVQCKRYIDSSFSNLKTVMITEICKMKKYNLKKYILITSLPLKLKERSELNHILNELSCDTEIIDAIEIQDILVANPEILKNNYKLWVTPYLLENVLNKNKLIDFESEILLTDVQDNIKYFVETKNYVEAKNIINNENILIVTGQPGVGKTTLCNTLSIYLYDEGYKLRYTSSTNIEDIIHSINFENDEKELIYMDDFLGKIYLNLRTSNNTDLLTKLINAVKRRKNKKLILNSRITILNEAESIDTKFKDYMEKINKVTINVDKMSKEEKGLILYKHLYHYDINIENIKYIINNEKYIELINHKNYNPRLIEQSIKNNKEIAIPQKFFNNIINDLSCPSHIWKDEYENRLEEPDRIILNILISFHYAVVKEEVIREIFNQYTYNLNHIDVTQNVFEKSLKRLNESFIKMYHETKTGIISIGTINPSVDDFLEKYLDINSWKKLLDSAIYIEQVKNIFVINKDKINIYETNLFNYKTATKRNINYCIIEIISDFNIKDNIYETLINNLIKNEELRMYETEKSIGFYNNSNLKNIIFNRDLREFYNINVIENMIEIIDIVIDTIENNFIKINTLLSIILQNINSLSIKDKKTALYKLKNRKFEIKNYMEQCLASSFSFDDIDLDDIKYIYNCIDDEFSENYNKILYDSLELELELDKYYIYSIIKDNYKPINRINSNTKIYDSIYNEQAKLKEIFVIDNFEKAESNV